MNAYTFWNKRLSGEAIEAPDEGIAAGYFRNAYWQSNGTAKRVKEFEAVAFWQDEGGEWCCARTKFGDGTNMNADQMRELFASCCKSPVSYEVYTAFFETGVWPEDAAPEEPEADASAPEQTPDEALAAELAKQQKAAREWLTKLGHKPATQEEADKAANFGTEFGAIETKAEKARKAEKEPHLEAGRKIDAKWNAIKDPAAVAKTWAKGLSGDFIKAEDARRKEAARIENERLAKEHADAVAKAKREAEEAAAAMPIGCDLPPVELPPEPAPVVAPEPVKVGTGARWSSLVKREVWEVVDVKSLLHFLADRNTHPASLIDAAQAFGEMLAKTGVEVPGMKSRIAEQVR